MSLPLRNGDGEQILACCVQVQAVCGSRSQDLVSASVPPHLTVGQPQGCWVSALVAEHTAAPKSTE